MQEEKQISDIALHLKNHGIRPSMQRMAIMEYLMGTKVHPSVDVIYTELLPKMPTLSRTTIYNTLELFREKGAIRILNLDNKTTRYDGNTAEHAHFVCRRCNRIYDVVIPDEIYAQLNKLPDHLVEQTDVNFTGVCAECLGPNVIR
ncbi:MAG: Fur family transcriptional regulator [Muribaculaceae bacterium]